MFASSCSRSDLVRAPTERAVAQQRAAIDSLRLFPRRLFCRQLDGMLRTLPSGHGTFRMASVGLRLSPLSNLYPLSQLERASGFMATSLSTEARGPQPCQHCLSKRRVRCLGRETAGMWYETCWRQWKGPAFDARLRHASRAPHLVSLASLRCHAEQLSCACYSLLGNDHSREAVGHQAHGSRLSPGERAGRDQDYRAWWTERKETSDAAASDHDP